MLVAFFCEGGADAVEWCVGGVGGVGLVNAPGGSVAGGFGLGMVVVVGCGGSLCGREVGGCGGSSNGGG